MGGLSKRCRQLSKRLSETPHNLLNVSILAVNAKRGFSLAIPVFRRIFASPNNGKNGQALDRRPVSLSLLGGGSLV